MRRHYSRAPIAEAVIDFRVESPPDAAINAFDPLVASLSDRFPNRSAIRAVHLGVLAIPENAPQFQTGHQDVGVRLDSVAKDRVLQLQLAGFTYSHLPQYTDWPTFREEARELWNRYLTATDARFVTRAAVRVINRLLLPGPTVDPSMYSNLGIREPDIFGLSPQSFIAQLHTSAHERVEGGQVIINFGLTPASDQQFELLLDFDVFVEGQRASNSSDLWSLLDKLSDIKDDIFESCITDETRRLIE